MKRILIVLLILVGVYFGTNYYFANRIEKQVRSAADAMQMMGGSLTYDSVKVNYKGDIVIDNLAVYAIGINENIRIDRAVMSSGSFFGVYKMANDFREKRLPSQMRVSVEGMSVIVGGEAFKQMSYMTNDEMLLCGEKATLDFDDFTAMGYGSTVKVNSVSEYTLFNEGQWIELTATTDTEGMNETLLKVDMSLNAASRDLVALGAAAGTAELNEVIIEYTDKGYADKVVDYCQQLAGIGREDYIRAHLSMWEDLIKAAGLMPGPNVTEAYEEFAYNPGHFRLVFKPTSTFNLQKIATTQPDVLLYEFAISMEVNGRRWDRMDLRAMTDAEEKQWLAEFEAEESESQVSTADTLAAKTTSRRPVRGKPFSVGVTDLAQYAEQEVILKTTSGNTIVGKILSANDQKVVVHSYQPGGYMEIPVKVTQIRSAQIQPGLQ